MSRPGRLPASVNELLLLPEGFTPLHAATMSHNAVLKELRDGKNLCVFRKTELKERRQRYAATVKLLLLMGASAGTKVSTACPRFRYHCLSVTTKLCVGSEKRTHVLSRGFGGGQRGAAAAFPRLFVLSHGD